jgi:hypothetical protein
MSVSCIGTCSACGAKRFWLSDTMSIQLDDGRLKCLPHPAERGSCESKSLTLAQASDRGRLHRETFIVALPNLRAWNDGRLRPLNPLTPTAFHGSGFVTHTRTANMVCPASLSIRRAGPTNFIIVNLRRPAPLPCRAVRPAGKSPDPDSCL